MGIDFPGFWRGRNDLGGPNFFGGPRTFIDTMKLDMRQKHCLNDIGIWDVKIGLSMLGFLLLEL